MLVSRTLTAAFGAALAALAPGLACAAGSATDTMSVTATIADGCIVTANPLGFGAYDPLSGASSDATTTLNVRCTTGTPYVVALNPGAGPSATVSTRKMISGANVLNYSLYRDAARTLVWGETSGVDTVAGTGNGSAQSLTVYGRAAGAQNAPAGPYADTVTVTVSY